MNRRWRAVVFAVQLLWPVVAAAQAPTPPIAAPPNPADPIHNPHPTMPWFGIATPYGQFLRWVWMPPQPIVANQQVFYQPGFWVAQTTAADHYPPRWVLQEVAPGRHGWVLVNGGAVSRAR